MFNIVNILSNKQNTTFYFVYAITFRYFAFYIYGVKCKQILHVNFKVSTLSLFTPNRTNLANGQVRHSIATTDNIKAALINDYQLIRFIFEQYSKSIIQKKAIYILLYIYSK